MTMRLLINLDVPELAPAQALYCEAFELKVGRRFDGVVELLGAVAPIYLLQKSADDPAAGLAERRYQRHWTPIHIDVVVDDLDYALARALRAGFALEGDIREANWGRIAQLADPFGHGWCLLQFLGRGYDEITS